MDELVVHVIVLFLGQVLQLRHHLLQLVETLHLHVSIEEIIRTRCEESLDVCKAQPEQVQVVFLQEIFNESRDAIVMSTGN